jgi:hypothetical protein
MTPEQEALRATAIEAIAKAIAFDFDTEPWANITNESDKKLYRRSARRAFDALHGIVSVVPPVLSLNIAEKYRAAVEGLPGDYRNLVAAGDLTRAPK